jgi:hypothetical protein
MNLSTYMMQNKSGRIPSGIYERWETRVEKFGWQYAGDTGAKNYLKRYGKGIGVPKLHDLGSLALQNGYPDFAREFFRRAALQQGMTLAEDVPSRPVMRPANVATVQTPDLIDFFPANMQPGRFLTMQPTDARQPREAFFMDDNYWGQPKVDGHKRVIFVCSEWVKWQSRPGKAQGGMNESPDDTLDLALMQLASNVGPFILEGELTFLDAEGGEHRTFPQAVTANDNLKSKDMPETKVFVFAAPWTDATPLSTYGDMVTYGEYLAKLVNHPALVAVHTVKTEKAKRGLAFHQQALDHEGEVWFKPAMPYLPGKYNDDRFARSKYLTDTVALVVGLTPTVSKTTYGSLICQSLDGRMIGNVSCGSVTQRVMFEGLLANGPFKVNVVSQGFTEDGILYQGRYAGPVEE